MAGLIDVWVKNRLICHLMLSGHLNFLPQDAALLSGSRNVSDEFAKREENIMQESELALDFYFGFMDRL